MPIDASIYSNIQNPKVDSPVNALLGITQLQQAQNQNRLADFDFQSKQRDFDNTQKLNSIFADSTNPDGTINRNKLYQGVASGGLGSKLPALQKQMADSDKSMADVDELKLKAAKTRFETIGQQLGYVKDNPTIENAKQAISNLVSSGIMPPEVAQQKLAEFNQDPSPEGVKRLATMGFQGALEASKQLPTFQTRNTGGKTDTLSINPVSGAVTVANSVMNTQSPDNAASNAVTMRGQNLADARAKETLAKDYAINGLNRDGTPTGDVETMAQGIASGKLAPINGWALAKPRGQAIMARVMDINPNYDAGDYAAKNNALKGFSTGKEGTALRSFNVASDHLDTLGQMADALNNGNMQILNRASNAWKQQTGSPAPTNFDAVKEIVGKEVVKAIVAGGGGVAERQEVSDLMSKANSPAQLKGVISHFKELMDAQKSGLMDQYQRTTGRTDGAQIFAPSKKSSTSDIRSQADAILNGGK